MTAPTGSGGTSWTPVDLGAILEGKDDLEPGPAMLARDDGACLLYAGKIHWFAGEPESGKGWLILTAAAERIRAGEHVLYLDFEDEGTTVVARLLALGLEPQAILERFHYIRPDEPLTGKGRDELDLILETYEPTLGLIDGMTDALALHGIDLRDNTRVADFMRDLPTKMRNRGMAVGITDHVVKDSESRGRWSIGAQHKLAKTDVQYRMKLEDPLGRGLVGRILVRVEKDRPGHIRGLANGRTVARVVATSGADGRMELAVQAVKADEPDPEEFRPTGYMERISRALEAEPGLSIRRVREDVTGGREYIDVALDVLVREEWVERRKEGAAQCHYVLLPYREAEDPNRGGNRGGTVANEAVGEYPSDRGTVAAPIGRHVPRRGDTVAANRGGGADHATEPEPLPFIDGVSDNGPDPTEDRRRSKPAGESEERVPTAEEMRAMGVEPMEERDR